MRPILVIPVHCTDSIQLLDAKNLKMNKKICLRCREGDVEVLDITCYYYYATLTGQRSWLISSNVFFGF